MGDYRRLAIVWVSAPLVAAGLGFVGTRLLDRVLAVRVEPALAGTDGVPAAAAGDLLAIGLVIVGASTSFVMGSNDVANASFGLFTSMNQALVGAMTGAGAARESAGARWPAAVDSFRGQW